MISQFVKCAQRSRMQQAALMQNSFRSIQTYNMALGGKQGAPASLMTAQSLFSSSLGFGSKSVSGNAALLFGSSIVNSQQQARQFSQVVEQRPAYQPDPRIPKFYMNRIVIFSVP